ncbi:unnamed protein product [Cladocopium goreaui]|uniref:Uncharacterized protein n=1 Tax=Cladocopium goreaui TaxID=2562237 RepID=A0A9P1GIT6_9DINO|nr:unnamed protein product [Cladocopium goreaui]
MVPIRFFACLIILALSAGAADTNSTDTVDALQTVSNLEGGHYIAYWKSGNGWQKVNNDHCSVASEQEVKEKAGLAYLLVYELAGYQGTVSWESLNEHAVSRKLLDQRLHELLAHLALVAAQRLLRLAPSEALLSRAKALPPSLLQGYADRPHTGLGSVLAAVRQDPSTRFLVLTRDVLMASGLCPSDLQRQDVDIQAMPRTREEAIALLQSRKNQEKPLMILCRWALHGTCSDTSFTSQAIHQLRRLADENDVQGLVLTILLPPWRFHVGKSYESALLGQWQVLHLDSLEDTEAPSLVTSILTNAPNLKPTEQLGCQEEVHKHLAAAVARLPSSDAMRRMADGWVDAERGMAQAVAFYAQAALQTRVDALWSLLTSDQFALLLDVLRRIPLAALQDISLQREAVATAKEMMGMDRCQRRPMLCLQTTVGNKCAERVVSALAAALHLICDQGGLQVLLQMGEEATFAVATDLALRVWHPGNRRRFPSRRPRGCKETAVLPCYPHLFHMLQECLLDSRADPDSDLVTAASSAWKKHPFYKLSDCVVNSGLMRSYCQYLAQRFGFPRVAAELLELEAALYAADEQLPGLHACAWCHRSDLLALSYLFRDGVPPKVLGELKAIDGHGTNFKTNEALFGPALASSVLDLLEEKLQEAMKATEELRKVHLNAWHHSFSAARATLGGRLLPTLSRSNRAKLHRLSFFSDLIPCMMDHGGLSILSELLAESRTMDRREMQNRCLARLATQLNRLGSGGAEVFFPTARAALQQILEDLLPGKAERLQPLRRESAQILELFRDLAERCESVELILDIVDSRGIFASCYALVTPALGAAALQGLLEAVQQHRGKRSEMLQRFSQEFCQKVGEHPCLHLPWNAWMEWTEEHDDDTSSLPWLLYYAWRGAGTELLELDGLQPLEELRRAAGASSAPNVFTAVRRAVRQQQLLASVAESVARKTLRTAEGQQLLLHLGAQGHLESF